MSNLFDRMKLFVQRDKEFRSALYDIMGFYPHNVEYYRIAFAHKSQEYKSKKTGDRPLNNERLEFLGDAVLETVVSDIVYHHFKNKREGFLTNTRSKIVSRESLGKLAKDLGIDRLIQSHTSSKAHNSFLAGNAFEAFMGAIYLDRGFDFAFRFIEHRIMGSVLDLEGVAHKEVNFKSKLLEWSQKNRIRIEYKDKQTNVQSSTTPPFNTTIILEGIFAGDGSGFSKKEAHQKASKDALTRMRREPKFIDEIFTSKEKRTAMEADPCFVLPVIDEIEDDLAREAMEKEQAKQERKHNEGKPRREQKQRKAAPQPAKATDKPAPKEADSNQQPLQNQELAEKAKQTPKKEQAQPKRERQNSADSKVETPKAEVPKVETPKKEVIIAEAPKAEALQEESAEVVAPQTILVPIALEEISEETAPTIVADPIAADVADENPRSVAATIATEQPAAEQSVAEQPAADQPVAEQPSAGQPVVKKSRRRGKRQNAAGFTNTEVVAAETSHRAEKAAQKVAEAKREKARKQARKTAKAAAKGVDVANDNNASEQKAASAEASRQQASTTAVGKKDAASTEASTPRAAQSKKPRRRKKTKAELPSDTPNPEHENTVNAALDAAYRDFSPED